MDEVMFRDKWKIDMFASAFVEFKDVSNNEQVKVWSLLGVMPILCFPLLLLLPLSVSWSS